MSTSTKSCAVCEVVKPIADFHQHSITAETSKGCVVCARNPFKGKVYGVKAMANLPAHREKKAYNVAIKREALKDLFHGR